MEIAYWKGEQEAGGEKAGPLANLTTPPSLATPAVNTPVSTRASVERPKGPVRGRRQFQRRPLFATSGGRLTCSRAAAIGKRV